LVKSISQEKIGPVSQRRFVQPMFNRETVGKKACSSSWAGIIKRKCAWQPEGAHCCVQKCTMPRPGTFCATRTGFTRRSAPF